jgi:hypothetical protein
VTEQVYIRPSEVECLVSPVWKAGWKCAVTERARATLQRATVETLGGRPKNPDPAILAGYAPDLTAADRRPIPNLVIEARRFSGLAVDTSSS